MPRCCRVDRACVGGVELPRRARSAGARPGRGVVPHQQAAAAAVSRAGDRHAQSSDRAAAGARAAANSTTRIRCSMATRCRRRRRSPQLQGAASDVVRGRVAGLRLPRGRPALGACRRRGHRARRRRARRRDRPRMTDRVRERFARTAPAILQGAVMHRRPPAARACLHVSRVHAAHPPVTARASCAALGVAARPPRRSSASTEPITGRATAPLALAWVRALLRATGVVADGEIVLYAFPRMLGYVFNPVSFWVCHDRARRAARRARRGQQHVRRTARVSVAHRRRRADRERRDAYARARRSTSRRSARFAAATPSASASRATAGSRASITMTARRRRAARNVDRRCGDAADARRRAQPAVALRILHAAVVARIHLASSRAVGEVRAVVPQAGAARRRRYTRLA